MPSDVQPELLRIAVLSPCGPTCTSHSLADVPSRPTLMPLVPNMQLGQDEEGAVTLQCSAVERGFLYPEEVAAQVRGGRVGWGTVVSCTSTLLCRMRSHSPTSL